MGQLQQAEWSYQWKEFQDDSDFLFLEWLHPATLDDFREKTVLDAGCGGGQHLRVIASRARSVTGVDLNTAEIARSRVSPLSNVTVLEGDVAVMDLNQTFDIVYSVGVVHHTDHPDRTVENLKKHVKPGGKLILWVYSYEGNGWNRTFLEPIKRHVLRKLPRPVIRRLAEVLTVLLYLPIHSIYLLPLRFLPYYEYFQNWRRLPFKRNLLNVFDKLNAPQTNFVRREQVERWLNPQEFSEVRVSSYRGVSWRASGTKI